MIISAKRKLYPTFEARQKDECRSIEVNEFLEEVSDLSGAFATFTPDQIKNLDFTSLGAGEGTKCRARLYEDMLKIYKLKDKLNLDF